LITYTVIVLFRVKIYVILNLNFEIKNTLYKDIMYGEIYTMGEFMSTIEEPLLVSFNVYRLLRKR